MNLQSQTLLVHFIQQCSNPRLCWKQGLDLASSQPVPAVTRPTLPSLRDFVESKISYKIEKVRCKTTESNKSYRKDRRD